jgi:hypothetical protein
MVFCPFRPIDMAGNLLELSLDFTLPQRVGLVKGLASFSRNATNVVKTLIGYRFSGIMEQSG